MSSMNNASPAGVGSGGTDNGSNGGQEGGGGGGTVIHIRQKHMTMAMVLVMVFTLFSNQHDTISRTIAASQPSYDSVIITTDSDDPSMDIATYSSNNNRRRQPQQQRGLQQRQEGDEEDASDEETTLRLRDPAGLFRSLHQVDLGFGDSGGSSSSNSTASGKNKYAPAPLLQTKLKLELGKAKWRREIPGYTSPACTMQVEDGTTFSRIVFLHMRKGGGTSARNYLRNVAAKHEIPMKIMEGWKEVEKPGDDPNTLYVTHIREPVSRAISHYKYEVRWDCKKQMWSPGFVPTLENQQMGLTEFATKHWKAGRSKYWTCSQECYSRWATGLFHNPRTDPELAKQGRKVLMGFHLVIVSEWLQDPEYARSLESIFGEKYIGRKIEPTCGKESRAANKAVPLAITEEQYDLIAKGNQIDMGIYRNLTTCPYGPQFWGRTIRFAPLAASNRTRTRGDEIHHGEKDQKKKWK